MSTPTICRNRSRRHARSRSKRPTRTSSSPGPAASSAVKHTTTASRRPRSSLSTTTPRTTTTTSTPSGAISPAISAATSSKIITRPATRPGTDKTDMNFRRSLPEIRCQSCLSPAFPLLALSRYADLVKMRTLVVLAALTACACGPVSQAGGIPEYTYQIVHTYPHDRMAYTQGLLYLDGVLYEGTGMYEESSIRKVKLETGEVLQKRDIPGQYFGEGIIVWKDHLLELTWKSERGFIYDLATFTPRGEFPYPGEGWGLTTDGKRIIMSDGTAELRFWDPETLRETGRITVTENGRPLDQLNELEWVKGEIYANVYQTERIMRIDPKNGKVTGWIDCRGLLPPADRNDQTDVLNGIAYDAKQDRLFVTGKRWPKLFEIKLIKRTAQRSEERRVGKECR